MKLTTIQEDIKIVYVSYGVSLKSLKIFHISYDALRLRQQLNRRK